jgi:divalent metal cation (Fe/Co/Zn/Cd) transporter
LGGDPRGLGTPRSLTIVLLSALGGSLKVVGGLIYGSRAALVDALTSIVNLLSALAVTRFEYLSTLPPDWDHHYGHHRLFAGGSIVTLVLYSTIGGAMLVELALSTIHGYEVHVYAPLYVALGVVPYVCAIALSRGAGRSFKTYAKFTSIELIEGGTVVASALGGALVSYVIDSLGAAALLAYLYFEIAVEVRELVHLVSDRVPVHLLSEVSRRVRGEVGVGVRQVRLREVAPGRYQGDITITLPKDTPVEHAHSIASRVEKVLEGLGIEVVVHVEPSEPEETRRESGDLGRVQ